MLIDKIADYKTFYGKISTLIIDYIAVVIHKVLVENNSSYAHKLLLMSGIINTGRDQAPLST